MTDRVLVVRASLCAIRRGRVLHGSITLRRSACYSSRSRRAHNILFIRLRLVTQPAKKIKRRTTASIILGNRRSDSGAQIRAVIDAFTTIIRTFGIVPPIRLHCSRISCVQSRGGGEGCAARVLPSDESRNTLDRRRNQFHFP